jgi:hypothetical protein
MRHATFAMTPHARSIYNHGWMKTSVVPLAGNLLIPSPIAADTNRSTNKLTRGISWLK